MSSVRDVLQEDLDARIRELVRLGVRVDVANHAIDLDVERLADARAGLDYWVGRCRGRTWEAQRDVDALVELCLRPPNRQTVREWSLTVDYGGARADVTYLVWRE